MKITILTLFPNMIRGFLEESIVKRAVEQKRVEIEIINMRDFAIDTYGTVDDKPYGGGAGMILRVDVISAALQSVIKGRGETRVFLTSAKGKQYNQNEAIRLSKEKHIVLIAGHYEEVDERVRDLIDEEISIGDYVMTGGEIAAVAIVDSVVRLLPDVLKKAKATTDESFFYVSIDELIDGVGSNELLLDMKNKGQEKIQLLEYPQYTRPELFEGHTVPEVLKSGDPKKIRKWQLKEAFKTTLAMRPDLLTKKGV